MSLIRIFAATALVLSGSIIGAQEPEKEPLPKAQIAFDISIEKLLQMPEFANISLEELIRFDPIDSPFGADFGIGDITRFSGAISLPKQVGDVAEIFYKEELPFDFMVLIRFSKESYVEQLVDHLANYNFSNETIGDVTLMRIPVTDTPTSVLLRRYDQSSIGIGTKAFLLSNINDIVSSDARKAWMSCAKGPVRFVFDLKGSISFVEEVFQLVDFGKAQDQLEKIIRQSDSLSVSMLPDDGSLLQFGVSATSVDTTRVLQKRLDFLSFELRTILNRLLKPLCEKRDEEPVAIDGISTNINKSDVTMLVASPKNLSNMLQNAIDTATEESKSVQAK